MSRHLALGGGRGGEFDRLRAIFARLGAAGRALGDDCALVPCGDTTLAVSVDLSVEGVHFRTDWLAPAEIGWRAGAGGPFRLPAGAAAPARGVVALGVAPSRQPGRAA